MRFGVVPNTQILDPVQQSLTGPKSYVFFGGQKVTIYIDRNQPRVLADELLHVFVTNPSSTTCPVTPTLLTSSSAGYNISGTGAAAASATGGFGGGGSCGTASGGGGTTACATSSIANTFTYTIPNPPSATATSNCAWGLGAGVTFNVAPGLTVCTTPGACQGATPKCVAGVNNLGTACPTGSTNGLGTSLSGCIAPATANATITILASSLTGVDVADPLNANTLVSTAPSTLPFSPPLAAPFTTGLGGLTAGQTVYVTFTTSGTTAYATKTATLLYSGCTGGRCTTVPGSTTLSFSTGYTFNYPSSLTTLPGANTIANGGAMNITIPINVQTAQISNGFGGFNTPPTGAAWVIGVNAGGITSYSSIFNIYVPPASPSPTPSAGSSPTSTPSVTPTASMSRGSTASSSSTLSKTMTASATSTPTPSPTISDTSRPSSSAQPDLAAIARQEQAAIIPPVVGAVGGVLFLIIAGCCAYVIRQRQARMEARMRMKASSRRFMGAQTSAYGNAHQDGAVHIGAAKERAERPAETTVMFQVALPQGELPSAGPGGRGAKRPARSNSMNKR